MTDRIFRYFFGFLMIFCGVTIYFLIDDPPADINGTVHEDYPSMLRSGSTMLWHHASKWLGLSYGICVIICFLFSLWIGGMRKGRLGPMVNQVMPAFLIYLLIFLALTVTWWNTSGVSPTTYIGGFPSASAWMIYGMWLFPFAFTVLYIFYFPSWIYTPSDAKQFEEILEDSTD